MYESDDLPINPLRPFPHAALAPRPHATPQPSPADVRQISAHALLYAHGVKVRAMHPSAEHLVRGGKSYSILDAAEAAIELHGGPGAIPGRGQGDGYSTIVQAMSTADFPAIISTTLRGLTQERRSEALQDILALTAQIEAASYKPESYSFVDLEDMPAPSAATTEDFHFANVAASGEDVRLYSLFTKILVTRQALTNDDRGFVRAAIAAFTAHAHRNEMQTIAGLIESTDTLSDGTALFDAGESNLVTATLDAAGLGTAYSTLRAQPTESGDVSDAAPAIMLVHSDDEFAALALTETLPADRRPRVVATANLSDATVWYLLGNPATHPVIARTRLDGSDVSAVNFGGFEPAIWQDRDRKTHSYPGVVIPATHSVGFNVVSRIGAIKCSKT